MRIAIDARELLGRPTGVGRYLSELLRGWNELAGAAGHDFVLCAPETVPLPDLDRLSITQAIAPGRGPWWEQWTLRRLASDAAADVLFAPAYAGPILSRMPMVVTIHDVSFAAHPEWFPPREGFRRRFTTRWSAARARRVLTVSDFSKREIVRCFGTDAATIEVVYSGATDLAAGTPSPGPPDAPMVLYVGSLFTRRHVPEMLEAFARLAARRAEVTMVIVGEDRNTPPLDLAARLRHSPVAARVSLKPYVSDAELSDLYARAAAFVFLSEYEGFGMTPLDAMAAGVPIVVLDTEVAREIYGPAAIYVTSPDPALVEAALERVLFDGEERARLIDAGRTMLERYSWRECAQRTLQALLSVASS